MSRKILRDSSGETIAETLVSILISALALTLLASVVATSVNIVTNSREHMDEFYTTEVSMVRKPESEATDAQVTLEVPLEPADKIVDVKVYSSGENKPIVYYKTKEE
ncbi:MAG: hypothetical protein IKG21_05380 [Atopobiaceae bacterium]|nr:hypothetical protein [Atopobiaceae bacterium]